jgi:hypothetical protein
MKKQIDTEIVTTTILQLIKSKLDWIILFYSKSNRIDCFTLLQNVNEELDLLETILYQAHELETVKRLNAIREKIRHTSDLNKVYQLANECYGEIKQLESDIKKELDDEKSN